MYVDLPAAPPVGPVTWKILLGTDELPRLSHIFEVSARVDSLALNLPSNLSSDPESLGAADT